MNIKHAFFYVFGLIILVNFEEIQVSYPNETRSGGEFADLAQLQKFLAQELRLQRINEQRLRENQQPKSNNTQHIDCVIDKYCVPTIKLCWPCIKTCCKPCCIGCTKCVLKVHDWCKECHRKHALKSANVQEMA